MLLTVNFGWGGLYGLVAAVAATLPFSASFMFDFRCKVCGASYFFDPSISEWNITGVNMWKPVQSRCPKCGAER